MAIQHLRSSTADKRPLPASMSDGQVAINTNTASPGIFFKDSAGALIKVGPTHVGTTAPNASPASGGATGNTVGEQWLDTTGSTYVLKIWDGSAWRSESGTFVDVNGDVMTGALGIIAGSASTPGLFFSGDTNTGLYSPGADQLALSTNGTGRLFVDASGNVGIKTSPNAPFHVKTGTGGGATPNTFTKALLESSDRAYLEFSSATTGLGAVLFSDDVGSRGSIFYDHNDDHMRFGVAGSERLRITSAGLVGIGTSSPSSLLHTSASSSSDTSVIFQNPSTSDTATSTIYLSGGTIPTTRGAYIRNGIQTPGSSNRYLAFAVNNTGQSLAEGMRLTSNGLGIGTTSPDTALTVLKNSNADFTSNATLRASSLVTFDNSQGTTAIVFKGATTNPDKFIFAENIGATQSFGLGHVQGGVRTNSIQCTQTSNIIFNRSGSENGRWDSSGRLLVGTSSARSGLSFASVIPSIQLAGASTSASSLLLHKYGNDANACKLILLKNRGGDPSSNGGLSVNDPLGVISFEATDGYGGSTLIGAEIGAYAETGHGSANDDAPTRLVFSTTADGVASPTERMRITSSGEVQFGDSSTRNRAITSQTDYYTAGRVRGATPWFIQRYAHKASGTGNAARAVITFSASAGTPEAFHRVKVTQSGAATRAYYEFLVSETTGTFSIVHDLSDYNKAQFTVSMSSPTLTITSGTATADWMTMCVEVETFEMGASMPSITTSTV